MTDTQRLRDAWADVREHIAAIAELHDVIAVEMGGHTDVEGAVGGAIRIMRTQRGQLAARDRVLDERDRTIQQLRDQVATLRAAYVRSIQADNEHFNQRVAQARKEAI